jgi:hypothetical protein
VLFRSPIAFLRALYTATQHNSIAVEGKCVSVISACGIRCLNDITPFLCFPSKKCMILNRNGKIRNVFSFKCFSFGPTTRISVTYVLYLGVYIKGWGEGG